jgi:hypothetical protein
MNTLCRGLSMIALVGAVVCASQVAANAAADAGAKNTKTSIHHQNHKHVQLTSGADSGGSGGGGCNGQ